jgi:orotate phosphoribosyltransferase
VLDRTRDLIDLMVRCDVLTFGDFVAKSGRRTPYFVNAGRYRTGGQVAELGRFYAEAIAEAFGDGSTCCSGRRTRASRWPSPPRSRSTPTTATTSASASTGRRPRTTGEGGSLVGHQLTRRGSRGHRRGRDDGRDLDPRDGPEAPRRADIELVGLVVGVDRRERGTRDDVSALDELADDLGVRTVALATVDDIVEHLRDREVDGRRVLADDDLARLAAYRAEHGVRMTAVSVTVRDLDRDDPGWVRRWPSSPAAATPRPADASTRSWRPGAAGAGVHGSRRRRPLPRRRRLARDGHHQRRPQALRRRPRHRRADHRSRGIGALLLAHLESGRPRPAATSSSSTRATSASTPTGSTCGRGSRTSAVTSGAIGRGAHELAPRSPIGPRRPGPRRG